MGGYKIGNQSAIHFITFATVEWVDVFTRKQYANIIVDSLKYCQQEKGLVIYGWCLMSNHLHLIVSAENDNLSDILRDFKKYTAVQLIKAIKENTQESRKNWMLWIFKTAGSKNSNNKNYQFWRQDNHTKELDTSYLLKQKLDYIHNNPVESGIVVNCFDYLYSSARNYSEQNGLLAVTLI